MVKDSGNAIPIVILIILVTILTRGLLVYYSNHLADDSFITFRYAENIAAGKGFVYNQGERILGTSTPLYTLLLAFLVKLGLPILLFARIINIGADCLSGILIFLLLKQFRTGVAALAAFFYVLFPRVTVWSISGMETSLYVFFIAASLYCYYKKNFGLTALFLGLTILTRVDGVLLGLAMVIHFVWQHRRFPVKIVLGSMAVVLPWLVFSFLYFGSPIPNSVPGKKALYSATVWETPKWRIFWEFLFLRIKIGWPMLLLALAGFYTVLTRARSYVIIALWTAFYFVFFFLGATKMHMWYYVPFYLGYLILVALGADLVFEKADEFWKRKVGSLGQRTNAATSLKTLRIVVISAVCLLAGLIYFQQMKRTVRLVTVEQIALEDIHKSIGLWLSENTHPTDTVCAEDIGYMGYYSGRYILDQDGLISPQVIPFNKSRDRLGFLKEYKPAYFLIGFAGPYFSQVIQSQWLEENYERMATFDASSVDVSRARIPLEDLELNVCRYDIFRRIKSTD
ncbi:MAG: glycosyltransferase family 39 protein [Candidatus Zixiibacteriota bacterium]|nr:MAG: glycosyltransferase family 39 protein [candidate division Zixibacteria bacterium]